MLNNFKLGKKGQVAETVTWVVATVIIVVTLIIFIFISSQVSKSTSWKEIKVEAQSFFLDNGEKITKRLDTKNNLALSINENHKDKINEWIKSE